MPARRGLKAEPVGTFEDTAFFLQWGRQLCPQGLIDRTDRTIGSSRSILISKQGRAACLFYWHQYCSTVLYGQIPDPGSGKRSDRRYYSIHGRKKLGDLNSLEGICGRDGCREFPIVPKSFVWPHCAVCSILQTLRAFEHLSG